jgi:hypothetical protein
MSCKCIKCKKPTYDCSSKLCRQCFLDSLPDNVSRNIAVQGRFYGEKLIKDKKEAQ